MRPRHLDRVQSSACGAPCGAERPLSRRSIRRIDRGTVLFFAVAFVLLVAVGRTRMYRDPGTFWHILAGERVLTHGLPTTDWMTFTFAGHPWIAHQWLAECAMALLHRAGGFDALLIATAGTLALVFTFAFACFVRAGVAPRWAAVITAFGVLTSVGHFHVRPSIASIAFFAVVMAILVAIEARRATAAALAWLIPLLVVWVNCHGAVVGGIATIGLVTAAWSVSWLFGAASPLRGGRDVLIAALVVTTCCCTVLVNPYGLEMVRTWRTIVLSPAIAEGILEHASVARARAWYVIPFAAWYVVLVATTGERRWRGTTVVSLTWLVLMLERVRHAPLFAVAALLSAAELLPCSAFARRLTSEPTSDPGARHSLRTTALSVLAALAIVCTVHATRADGAPVLARLDHDWWPTSLIPELRRVERELGPGAPILNDTFLGGFIEFHAPGLAVFSDDRCELFGDDFMRKDAAGEPSWYASVAESHRVVVALAQRNSRLHEFLAGSGEWLQVADGGPAVLFRRRLPEIHR